MNSRRKGKVGELEFAQYLRAYGFTAARGVQYKGAQGSPDVVHNIPDIHFEVKRCEAGNPYDWLEQATRDSGKKRRPVVAHRRNCREWVAILPMSSFLEILGGVHERINDGSSPGLEGADSGKTRK